MKKAIIIACFILTACAGHEHRQQAVQLCVEKRFQPGDNMAFQECLHERLAELNGR